MEWEEDAGIGREFVEYYIFEEMPSDKRRHENSETMERNDIN